MEKRPFLARELFATVTTGHLRASELPFLFTALTIRTLTYLMKPYLVGACIDWPMRVMAVVIAANVNSSDLYPRWPVHIYKSPGVVGTTIGYTLASVITSNVLSTRMVERDIGTLKSFLAAQNSLTQSINVIESKPTPVETTEEDILQWSTELIEVWRQFFSTAVPLLRRAAFVFSTYPAAGSISNIVLFPLRKVATCMMTQAEPAAVASGPWVSSIIQNPITVVKKIIETDGVLSGLFGGVHLVMLQSVVSLGCSLAAWGLVSHAINRLNTHVTKFMNYQQKNKKIYPHALGKQRPLVTPRDVHDSLKNAALSTMRWAPILLSVAGGLGLMLCGRFITMPISFLTNIRLAQSSPLASSIFHNDHVASTSDFQLFKEMLTQPLRGQLWHHIAHYWKWFMLGGSIAMLGFGGTSDLELK